MFSSVGTKQALNYQTRQFQYAYKYIVHKVYSDGQTEVFTSNHDGRRSLTILLPHTKTIVAYTLYRVGQKVRPQTHDHNSVKSQPI